jgi:hypothetical protein
MRLLIVLCVCGAAVAAPFIRRKFLDLKFVFFYQWIYKFTASKYEILQGFAQQDMV